MFRGSTPEFAQGIVRIPGNSHQDADTPRQYRLVTRVGQKLAAWVQQAPPGNQPVFRATLGRYRYLLVQNRHRSDPESACPDPRAFLLRYGCKFQTDTSVRRTWLALLNRT